MKRMSAAVRRWLGRYVPGILMAIGLAAAGWVMWIGANFDQILAPESSAAWRRAEDALRKTGLGAYAFSAAKTSLGYSDYFRDGDSLCVFDVQWDARETLYDVMMRTSGWNAVQVTAEEYAEWATNFFEPASLVRPMESVVFDAFYFKDRFPGDVRNAYFADWDWSHLPASLGMEHAFYTTDFDTAFYDKESGVFFYYDQRM